MRACASFSRERAHFATPDVTVARLGRRAAYGEQPFFYALNQTTPRHGQRPFELAHLDHTELDLLLVSSVTGKPLEKPWLTLLTDASSRRILACYVSYDPPSYRSTMMILRICVQRQMHIRFTHSRMFKYAEWIMATETIAAGVRITCHLECSLNLRYRFFLPILSLTSREAFRRDLTSLKQAIAQNECWE